MLPTHINDDRTLDFVMIAFCPNQNKLHGIEHNGPSISYLVPFVSNESGGCDTATDEVFSKEIEYIEHMARKWVEEDFNGDGRLAFTLSVNWDNGRLIYFQQKISYSQ